MAFDEDRLETDWNDFNDPERAVAEARVLMEAVVEQRLDPVENLGEIQARAEPLWDGPGGDPDLVLRAARACEAPLRNAESDLDRASEARIALRIEPQIFLARAHHRARPGKQALIHALNAMDWLEKLVGGPEPLSDVLARPVPNVVAELTVAALGIYPAALRRAGYPQSLRDELMYRGHELVRAYVLRGGEPLAYPRTLALASQWFYATVEAGDPGLVRALYELDANTRPSHKRARATEPLRDLEMERRFGPSLDEARARERVLRSLTPVMERHVRVVTEQNYVAA